MSDDIDFENNISRAVTRNGRPSTSTSTISFKFDEIVSRKSEEKVSDSLGGSVWARTVGGSDKGGEGGSAMSYSGAAYDLYFARDFKRGPSHDASDNYIDDFEAED